MTFPCDKYKIIPKWDYIIGKYLVMRLDKFTFE